MRTELIDVMASDKSVVRSARVSTLGTASVSATESEGLINYLMREKHASPFEHNVFTWLVEAPIFVAREFMRHRIASYNEESGRYKVLEGNFYVPNQSRPLRQIGKTSEYKFDDTFDEDFWKFAAGAITESYQESWEAYMKLIDAGVAKEVARMVLPVGIYSSWYVTINARSLMNFLSLRTADNAQWEIREIAKMMEADFAFAMPITHAAWVANGRQSI